MVGSSERVGTAGGHAKAHEKSLLLSGVWSCHNWKWEWVGSCSGRGRVVEVCERQEPKLCHRTETDSSPRLAGGSPNAALATPVCLLAAHQWVGQVSSNCL
jgi:hypothetical protein